MIILSAIIWMNRAYILATGILLIAGHNLLDKVHVPGDGIPSFSWALLHETGHFTFGRFTFFVHYPLLPWIGIMALGYWLGGLYSPGFDLRKRRKIFISLGLASIGLFILLRSGNWYGDAAHWSVQKNNLFSVLSFLNVTKYPPSLLYTLMTLGPAFTLLRAFDRPVSGSLRPVLTIGRVPLFYFVAHLAAIHGLAVLICWLRYGAVHWMFESPDLSRFPITEPPGWPLGLPAVYAIWISLVLALYPLCRWYAAVKARSRSRWLSYL